MSFTREELYEVNDALHEVVTRMCEQGQTAIEIREHSLRHLWSASKKVTVMLLVGNDLALEFTVQTLAHNWAMYALAVESEAPAA